MKRDFASQLENTEQPDDFTFEFNQAMDFDEAIETALQTSLQDGDIVINNIRISKKWLVC